MEYKEIYREYLRVPNRFIVSNLGNIRSLKTGKIIKVSIDKYGYARIAVIVGSRTNKTRKHLNLKVHQMVAETFLGRPTINHKDGDKCNNSLDNLEWCSISDNVHKGWLSGAFKNVFSKETRAKIGLAHRGRKQSREWVKKRITAGLITKKNKNFTIYDHQ